MITIGGIRQRINKVTYRGGGYKLGVPYVDVTAVFGTEIKHCTECGFPTRHDQTASGEWICWCGNPFIDEGEIERDQAWLGGG